MFSDFQPPPEQNTNSSPRTRTRPDSGGQNSVLLIGCGIALFSSIVLMLWAISNPSEQKQGSQVIDSKTVAAINYLQHTAGFDITPGEIALENVGKIQIGLLAEADRLKLEARNKSSEPNDRFFREGERYLWDMLNKGRELQQISDTSQLTSTLWIDTQDTRTLQRVDVSPETLRAIGLHLESAALLALVYEQQPSHERVSTRRSQLAGESSQVIQDMLLARIEQLHNDGNIHLAEALTRLMNEDPLNQPPPPTIERVERP